MKKLQVPAQLAGDEGLPVVRQAVDADDMPLPEHAEVLLLRRRHSRRLLV